MGLGNLAVRQHPQPRRGALEQAGHRSADRVGHQQAGRHAHVLLPLGGLGSAPGSIVGAFVVTVAPEWLRFLKDYRIIVYALIILSVLIFAPTGLYGAIGRLRRRLVPASGQAAG